MPHPFHIGDQKSALLEGLSSFWQRLFADYKDLDALYQASEIYLGQVYLDLLSRVLNIGIVDAPIFNKEYWKLFPIRENDIAYAEGAVPEEDRYKYLMPGSQVDTDFIQNTIFNPTVTFEKNVDFDVFGSDGYIQFFTDPFCGYQDEDTDEWFPVKGVPWRYVDIAVGNSFEDMDHTGDWRDDTDVKRGDVLRMISSGGPRVYPASGVATGGQFLSVGGELLFLDTTSTHTFLADKHEGDFIHVTGATGVDEVFNGYYTIKRKVGAHTVALNETSFAPLNSSAGSNLQWQHTKGVRLGTVQDYTIDYCDGIYLVGEADNPFSLERAAPISYSVIREVPDAKIIGFGLPVGFYPYAYFGVRHIKEGSLKVYAKRSDGSAVVEGEDYAVDYIRGRISKLDGGDWDDSLSLNRCDFEYYKEVLSGAGGKAEKKTLGRVKQLALWAPEVQVDNFHLYYNYGYLLNRFSPSSDTYKEFLRGIMYLYTSGPVLQRIAAAMNLAAGYPVIFSDGEVLQGYESGVREEGTDGELYTNDRFSSAGYTFTESDVGGYLIISDSVSEKNTGRFRIDSLVDSHTVLLSTSYGFDAEVGLTWKLSWDYTQRVTTDQNVYEYPLYVPVKEALMDPSNFGKKTFVAFEPLTDAFMVVDYIEDPMWWHTETIPSIIWDETRKRRLSSTRLYENICNPIDDARVGDPGLYCDGDDEGNIAVEQPALRHNVAFVLFDRLLKMHMFNVRIADDLELSDSFRNDLEDLILVAKPSGTYPMVDVGDEFFDSLELYDIFDIASIKFNFGEFESISVVDNRLIVGETPLLVGDYFRYETVPVTAHGSAPPAPGSSFVAAPANPNLKWISLILNSTIGGVPVREGIDYTVDYDPYSPTHGTVTISPTSDPWDAVNIEYRGQAIELDNNGVTPVPDTTLGFTPIHVNGDDPSKVRQDVSQAPFKTEHLDRPVSLAIDAGGGTPYTYP